MAYSPAPADYLTITTQNGVTDQLNPQPADNCHTIILLNLSTTDSALYALQPTGTDLSTANAATLPPGAAITLRLGTEAYRGRFGVTYFLLVEGIGATPTLSIQYLNSTVPVAP